MLAKSIVYECIWAAGEVAESQPVEDTDKIVRKSVYTAEPVIA